MTRQRLHTLCLLSGLVALLLGTSAQGGSTPALLVADFEQGLQGWNQWVAQGVGEISPAPEVPPLGTGAMQNNTLVAINGFSPDFVGGIWTIVPAPVGQPLQLDGFWRTAPSGANMVSAIVYDFNGLNAPQFGVNVPEPPAYVAGNGPVNGIMFDTANLLRDPLAGALGAGSATGQVIVLIRSQGPGVLETDDIWLQVAAPNLDFNLDGAYDCGDMNLLEGVIDSGVFDPLFDVNTDGVLNSLDVFGWLNDAGELRFGPGHPFILGDTDLNGNVDGSDFGIWNANKFSPSRDWCQGDFNQDDRVDGSDFGIWNGHKFSSSVAAAVPEPAALGCCGALGLGLAVCWSRKRRRNTW